MMTLTQFCEKHSCREISIEVVRGIVPKYSKFAECLQEFQQAFREGDTVYYYDAEVAMWDQGFGSEGYLIVRDGAIIDQFVLKMN